MTFKVRSIDHKDCIEWCKYKHYAHRVPPISFSFGLFQCGEFDDSDSIGVLVGICTYGKPIAFSLVKNVMSGGGKILCMN